MIYEKPKFLNQSPEGILVTASDISDGNSIVDSHNSDDVGFINVQDRCKTGGDGGIVASML